MVAPPAGAAPSRRTRDEDLENTSFDDLMEKTK
jgi:hypothetical protein